MSVALKQRVLVVDDEPQVLVALEDLLSHKFTVCKASSAESALNFMEREDDVAVILSDQRMPKMNGDELLAKLGALYEAKRIMVTGFADLSAVVRAVNEGQIFAYVTKPWNEEDLLLKVSKAAEQFQLTQQLATERRLLEERTRVLNSVLEGMGEGVLVTDRRGKFFIFNQAARRILGADALSSELADWSRVCGVFETDQKTPLRPEHNPLFWALSGKESEETELFVDNDVVSDASVVMTATPLRDETNDLIGGIALLRDVTERRHLQAQLLQAQKMEAVGQLAGGVAHDFNNLLAVIHSYGELVLDEIPQGDAKRGDLEQLLGAAQRASSLTKQLLAFSRQQPMQKTSIQLNDLVTNIEKILKRLVGDGVELDSKLESHLPVIYGDASQMEQIILNLAVNARDAMPNGGQLSIETYRTVLTDTHATGDDTTEGDFVVIAVRDTGTGISAEVQKRIFDPFFTTKAVGKGTGLGLSTVYGIVRQSGGHISVESEIGKGTCFRVFLPVLRGAAGTSDAANLPATFGHETILLVEDEEPVRRVATRILRERGYTVLEAAGAAEARRLFARHTSNIELVIADLVLPDARGEDLVAEFKNQRPDVRVLFVSGHASRPAPGETESVSTVMHLEKPFTPVGLIAAVRTKLARTGSDA